MLRDSVMSVYEDTLLGFHCEQKLYFLLSEAGFSHPNFLQLFASQILGVINPDVCHISLFPDNLFLVVS